MSQVLGGTSYIVFFIHPDEGKLRCSLFWPFFLERDCKNVVKFFDCLTNFAFLLVTVSHSYSLFC